jgi:tetratricopeptide (TPR) repeat protein
MRSVKEISTMKNLRPAFASRLGIATLTLALLATLPACGGKEQRLAEHLQKGKELVAAGDLVKARVELKNVLQIDPKKAEAYFVIGDIEQRQGAIEKAYANFSKVVELDPANLPAVARLARIYLMAGDATKAEEAVNKVLAAKPDDPETLTVRAALLAKKGDMAAAIEIGRKVIQAAPQHAEAYAMLAGIYMRQKDPQQAADILGQGIQKNPQNGELRQTLITLLIQDKQFDKAIGGFRDLIAMEPAKFEYRMGLARLYAAQKDLPNAEKVLREAIAADPKDDERPLQLAEFLAGTARAEDSIKTLVTASETLPDAHRLRFALAQLYLATGKAPEAEKVFDTIVTRDKTGPDGLRARDQLASLRVSQARTTEAETLIAEVLKENPRDNDALMLRGQLALNRGDAVSAIADFRSVLKDQPNSLAVIGQLARAHIANHEPAVAVETMGKALEFYHDDANVRMMVAEVKAYSGDQKGALDDVRAVLKVNPKDVKALNQEADLEMAMKDWAAADKTLKALREAQPDSGIALYRIGMLAQAQKKSDAAINAFEQSLAKAPGAIEPLTGLVNALIATGKADKALQKVNGVIATNPKNALAFVLLGRLQDRQGQRAEAEASFRKGVELAPTLVGSHGELANFFAAHGEAKAAETALQAGLKALPGNPQLHMQLADIYRRDKQIDAAIAQYETVLKDRPGEDAAANNLANLLLDEKTDKASNERALQLASRFKTSQNVAFVDTLGWAHAKLGQVDEALPLLRQVAEKAPGVPVFQYHLGAALMKKGDLVAAKPLLEKAVGTKGEFPGKSDAKAMLAKV